MTKRRKLIILKGAVEADVSKQEFCTHCHEPIKYYLDKPFICQACGKKTLFTALEQKKWIEDFKFHPGSFPKECKECRKKLREGELIKVRGGEYRNKGK